MTDSMASIMDGLQRILELLNRPLFIVDNNPISIKTIVVGIFLLVIGYFISRGASKAIGKNIISRMDIDHSLRHTLQTIVFYFMLIIFTFFVMGLLNIPVTIFTVVGGALAIGVGLGAQNIVNNFISGIIIMVERPVKVGDFVEIEQLAGRIEHVGARSTQIKSLDNTHFVVPNSHFIEQNVLNWTLSDDLVRTNIAVGVAYGSETDLVEKLLKQAAAEEDQILQYPEPLVLFCDFGASSLDFKVYFWTRLKDGMQLKMLQSRMRFRVDQLFREHDVVISFPQRDIHLDTAKPLEIKMLGEGEK